jgi:hypothetical protein
MQTYRQNTLKSIKNALLAEKMVALRNKKHYKSSNSIKKAKINQ